ncbi:MAG TPA: alpha/beta fold hydrolase [Polyangiales bacterium]|nr:alpha/beta fold hydrolase [Polyangiales bacterium]
MRAHTRSHTSRESAFDLSAEAPRSITIFPLRGGSIQARIYEPEGAIHGNVLIHSATACPQRFYEAFAKHLARGGLRVFTYDYRGIGASRGRTLRGEKVTMADWAQIDARALHEYIARNYPEQRLALVGHSFGGQLIGLLDEARAVSAAVFVGAQFGYYGYWPRERAAQLRRIWKFLVPALSHTLGYVPKRAGIGEDLPRGVALQWARWCSHPDYLVSEFPSARARYARFDRPILAYSFSDDDIAPERAVEALYSELVSAPVTHRKLSPDQLGVSSVGHFGFFRKRTGAALWDEAREFLIDSVRETHSGAA